MNLYNSVSYSNVSLQCLLLFYQHLRLNQYRKWYFTDYLNALKSQLHGMHILRKVQKKKCELPSIPELLKLVSSLNKFIFLKLIRLRQHFLAPPSPRPRSFILCFLGIYFAPTYSPLGNFTWIPYNWPWFFPSILAFVTGTIHHVSASNSITGVIWNLCLIILLHFTPLWEK